MTVPTDVVDKPTAAPPIIPLTLLDRCDRCGAQAFVRAAILTVNGAVDLLFCGHHYRVTAEKLATVAVRIQDETARINEKPSASSA